MPALITSFFRAAVRMIGRELDYPYLLCPKIFSSSMQFPCTSLYTSANPGAALWASRPLCDFLGGTPPISQRLLEQPRVLPSALRAQKHARAHPLGQGAGFHDVLCLLEGTFETGTRGMYCVSYIADMID